MKAGTALEELIRVMARLRAPQGGCPWDLEQDHRSLRYYAVEEAYELMDAIEMGDEAEMIEELGDLLLQVVFHCQLARERGAFDFETVCRRIVGKLIHRHPHVFGDKKVRTAEAVLRQWDQLKRAEKKGTRHERPSALDGIPRHLPALLRAQKLVRKARKAGLLEAADSGEVPRSPAALGQQLFALAQYAQQRGWNAEEGLRRETRRRDRALRRREKAVDKQAASAKLPRKRQE
jgi:uncharacterized protein YabN with tetrapyrrole methylase and pyrophosphatase domain